MTIYASVFVLPQIYEAEFNYLEANRLQAKKGEAARELYLHKFNAWIYRLRTSETIIQT